MRLFLALTPPVDAVEHLAEFLAPRWAAGSDRRWSGERAGEWRFTDPEHWHITLAFMPEAPERALDRLVEAAAQVAERHHPLLTRLEGAGAFPSPAEARVLWLGLPEADRAWAGELAEGMRGAASVAGAAPEGGRFVPHVTIGRTRHPVEATRWLRVLDAYEGPGIELDAVHLVQSHLGEGRRRRPRYEVLETLPLGV